MRVEAYQEEYASIWNQFVTKSRNGTFLFLRPYMDYHRDRFEDGSFLFFDDKDVWRGVFPANVRRGENLIQSHGGLTYGGLVLDTTTQVSDVRDMMTLMAQHYLDKGFSSLQYKPTPYIYHQYPADEDLYWLYRAGAKLQSRAVSSAILLDHPEHSKLWHRKIKHNACLDLQLHEDCMEHLPDFWKIVCDVLMSRHQTTPVHSASEIALLHNRLPNCVKLFTVTNGDGQVITGAVLFVTRQVVHVQYMEAGDEARRRRALDWLIQRLIARYEAEGKRYFEFGISTEDNGRYLNEGLAYQKEGFGGRGICYDAYWLDIPHMIENLKE